MRARSEPDRDVQEHERERFIEQVRLYRRLSDEERLVRFFAWCAAPGFERTLEERERTRRRWRDRERDEVLLRVAEA